MHTGTVKFFDNKKGYGFITPDGGGEDLFVHFSEIKMEGFKVLKEGQRVSYVPAKGPKGEQATQVQALDT
jgi:CspA family cold shock protein